MTFAVKTNLQEWLSYLESLDPHKIQLGLDRTQRVAQKLGIQKFKCPVVTVTGTNGKGSTVIFIESIYQAAGYRTGAYISPHLFRFHERIRVQGHPVDDDTLIDAFEAVENTRADISLTYFEFTTLAAFQIFKKANLDVLILEVGLGGRLDAVNVIDADVAVITTIGIDHVEWLGHTRESIAREKSGIFRLKQTAICSDSNPPKIIYDLAKNLDMKIYTMTQDFFYQKSLTSWSWQTKNTALNELPLPNLPLENAATSLMVIDVLQLQLKVQFHHITKGLQQATLPGRFQKIKQCIFDVAHNPQAASWLAQRLKDEFCMGRTIAVIGMLADKDILGTLQMLEPVIDIWYLGGLTQLPRGASSELLSEALAQMDILQRYSYHSVPEAYRAALEECKSKDRVIICGSFHTVSLCLHG